MNYEEYWFNDELLLRRVIDGNFERQQELEQALNDLVKEKNGNKGKVLKFFVYTDCKGVKTTSLVTFKSDGNKLFLSGSKVYKGGV